MRKLECPGLCNLPQNTVGAVAAVGLGFVKGVDGRNAIIEYVKYRDHFQCTRRAIGPRFAELNQSGVDPALQQELCVLVDAVLVHATTGVPTILIAEIQTVVFLHETQFEYSGLQV